MESDRLLSILSIEGRLEYNTTMVECVGFFIGRSSLSSPVVFLLIQGCDYAANYHFITTSYYPFSIIGTLDAVGSLSAKLNDVGNLSISVTWEAPFSLNLTNIEPDLTYNVLVTLDGDEDILFHDSVNEATLLYIIPQHRDLCDSHLYTIIFNVTVIPVNGAGHGVPNQIQVQCKYSYDCDSTNCIIIFISMYGVKQIMMKLELHQL